MKRKKSHNAPLAFTMTAFFVLLGSVLLLTGCKSTYDVTLNNGTKFSGVSKPAFNKETGKYHFKTPDGREGAFYPEKIRLIEPQREAYEFGAPPRK